VVVEEERKQVREKLEEDSKKEDKKSNWWDTVPMPIKVGAGFLLLLAWKGMSEDNGNGNFYITIIIAVVILLLMNQQSLKQQQRPISPKEAYELVEMELELKRRFGQFPMSSEFDVGPVINTISRDAGGMYYLISVMVNYPHSSPEHYIAKVMIGGLQKGYVFFLKTDKAITGWEKEQETTIFPKWVKNADRYSVIGNVIDDAMRGKR
jgi:hypothetical protein